MDLKANLKTQELFAGLSDLELEEVVGLAEFLKYEEGDEIFHEHDQESDLFILLDGRVQVNVALNKRENAVFHTILPGKLFGEFAFIDRQPRSATAVAVKQSSMVRLRREAMFGLFERNARVGYTFMKNLSGVLARRIRQTAHELKTSLMWEQA